MAAAPGQCTVLYFAAASSYTGKESEVFSAPTPLARLLAAVEARYPGIRASVLDSCLVTVNLDYVDVPSGDDEGVLIQAADEVAIIPPGIFRPHRPTSNGCVSPPPRCDSSGTVAHNVPTYRCLASAALVLLFLLTRRSASANSQSSRTANSVALTATAVLSTVYVETLHPNGFERSSHRSARAGQMSSW
ncbi:Molybdopterin synthase sulfur carrier subunit [Beauveria bassiana]|nr:Molybdopterin synthase sulfur carrier subunit [Beauveria bassiana]